MPEPEWTVTEHLGQEGFAALEADWRRLYAQMPDPAVWHSYEACSAFLSNLCSAPSDFRCLALADGERVRAILPLEDRLDRGLHESGLGVRMRVWGMPWRKENWALTDAIGPEDDARRALLPAALAYLRRRPDRPSLLAIGRTRESSLLWDGLEDVPARKWFSFEEPDEFVMRTDMAVEAFKARLSRNTRQTLRRAERRFEALGGTARVRSVAREDLPREYAEFVRIEASGWKGERGSAIRQSPGEEGFYRDLLEQMRLDGHCEIHSLHAEGRCIASGFWAFTRRQGVMLKCGYDESHAHESPGRVLTNTSLEWCCADPAIESVSMLGDAPWLAHWAPETHAVRRGYVSLRPISGTLLLVALRFRFGPVRRAVRAYREWRRSRDDRTLTQRGRDAG